MWPTKKYHAASNPTPSKCILKNLIRNSFRSFKVFNVFLDVQNEEPYESDSNFKNFYFERKDELDMPIAE